MASTGLQFRTFVFALNFVSRFYEVKLSAFIMFTTVVIWCFHRRGSVASAIGLVCTVRLSPFIINLLIAVLLRSAGR